MVITQWFDTVQCHFQVLGRNIIVFCMIEAEPRMWEKPVVFYLFLVWSSVELVRWVTWSSVGIKVLCDYLKSGFALSTFLKFVVCW